jgi:prepilin-type N-terminal cleavage/methylation domain-containing protein
MTRQPKSKAGFTLLELLVVLAVIASLTALLFPVLTNARKKVKRAACMSNVKQINLGLRMYSDDSSDRAPRTPGTTNSPGLNWTGYKTLMKSYVGLNGASSSQDKLFACPADTFYYDLASNFQRVSKGLHEQPQDYLSYAFNGGNARTNSNAPGIAGRVLSSIVNPTKTVLIAESPAFTPYSWHQPKPPTPNGAPMFDDAMNMVSFVDGHVSYIKIYWGGNNPPGSLALHHDPPAGYNYKWSGD